MKFSSMEILCLSLALALRIVNCDLSGNLDQLFEEGDAVSNLHGKTAFIAFVGGSGTGKSTLTKFMRYDLNLDVIENEGGEFVFTDKEDRIGNDNPLLSKTLYPHVDFDNETGELLVDLAGFGDNRHATYELLSSFFNKKMLETARKIKIVVVENFERLRLGAERNAFELTMKHLEQLLPEDLEPFRNSISLIATKVESGKEDYRARKMVLAFIDKFIPTFENKTQDAEQRGEQNAAKHFRRMVTLVQFLRDAENIAFFHRPESPGNPYEKKALVKDLNKIRDVVFRETKYSDSTEQQYQVSVSAETKIYTKEVLLSPGEDRLLKMLENYRSIIADSIVEIRYFKDSDYLEKRIAENVGYFKQMNESLTSVTDFNDMYSFGLLHGVSEKNISSVKLQFKKIAFFRRVALDESLNTSEYFDQTKGKLLAFLKNELNFYTFLNILSTEAQSYDFIVEKSSKTSAVNLETFDEFIYSLPQTNKVATIKTVGKTLNLDNSKVKQINRMLSELVANTVTIDKNNISTIIRAKYIVLSQHKASVRMTCKGQLMLMAEKKVFLDEDLELMDTHLLIAAPVIEVVGKPKRKIALYGSKGAEYDEPSLVPQGMGSPGRNGSSSGDLTIFALEVVNADNLIVLSVGGDGGSGQEGGVGADGVKSSTPSISERYWGGEASVLEMGGRYGYETEIGEQQTDRTKSSFLFLYSTKTYAKIMTVTLTNKKDGKPPTPGGEGGVGGFGAPPGHRNLIVQVNEPEVTVINGQRGTGGNGGKGGNSVPMCAKKVYNCLGTRESTSYIIIFDFNDGYSFQCANGTSEDCKELYPLAENGKKGKDAPFQVGQKKQLFTAAYTETQAWNEYGKFANSIQYLDQKTKSFMEYISSALKEFDEPSKLCSHHLRN